MLDLLRNAFKSLGERLGFLHNLQSLPFSFQDSLALDTLGHIDFALHFSFGLKNFGPFDSFTFGLELHASSNLVGWLDVFDLVPHAVDAPLDTGCVESNLDVGVQTIPLFESPVQHQLPYFRPHACLSEQRQRIDGVIDGIGCLVGVIDLEEQDSVDFDFDVVLGNGCLPVNVDHLFLQTVVVRHFVKEWKFKAKARLQHSCKLAKPLYHFGFLLMS